MRCPMCDHKIIPGDEICEHCHCDLSSLSMENGDPVKKAITQGKVRDLNMNPPITVSPEERFEEVVRLIKEKKDSCVLVTENGKEDGKLEGIITERDILMKTVGVEGIEHVRVEDLMTPDPVVLKPDDPLSYAFNRMAVGDFRHNPVVKNGIIVGVITVRDLLQHIVNIHNVSSFS